jgi:hypothetical protein
MGPARARLSVAGYAAVAVAALVAAAIIGDQPCDGGGSVFNPFGLD